MRSSNRLVDLTLREYTQRLSSGEPTPGGGSAAALAGGLAAALAAMVARLTISRKKYAEHEAEMQIVLDQAERLRNQLLALVDADTAAFQDLMAAYGLPKSDRQAVEQRQSAIQEALRHATDIPLATAEASIQVLNLAVQARERGNRHAAGDAVVAALLAHAATLGAVHDVRVNLQGLHDPEFRAYAEARVAGLVANADAALKRALKA